VEHLALAVLILNLGPLKCGSNVSAWQDNACNLAGGSWGILLVTAREDDELVLVSVESFNIHLELLLAGAGSPVVDSDADGAGLSIGELSGSELSKSESTTVAELSSILASCLGDNWTQAVNGSGEHTFSLCDSILVSLDLLSRLVEVSFSADASIPVLAQMYVGDSVVVLDHC